MMTQFQPRFAPFFAFVPLAMILAGCAELQPVAWTDPVEETLRFPAEGVRVVSVEIDEGKIAFVGEPEGAEIVVLAEKTAGGIDAPDAQRALEALEIVSESESSSLRLRWNWKGAPQPGWGGQVNFTIRLPRSCLAKARLKKGEISTFQMISTVDLVTASGDIKVEGHQGNILVETGQGTIALQAMTPRVEALSRMGDIVANLNGSEQLGGKMIAEKGSIKLILGPLAAARIDAEVEPLTESARITPLAPMKVTNQTRTHFKAVLGRGGETLKLQAKGGGAITIE
jgi:hypothetical protein